MQVDVLCKLCGNALKTVSHALWGYSKLKSIRLNCGMMSGVERVDELAFLDLMLLSSSRLSRAELELLGIVLWKVWFRRNRVIHGGSLLQHEEVVAPIRWKLSASGSLKLNVDVVLCVDKQLMGVGLVLRDHSGLVVRAAA
ncbi:hypothetical protein ACOSQ2_024472 [Xanthoceras sorbifolium]